jgi:hypothetical protein
MGSQQDTVIAHLATQLELREQQLQDTTQQLEASRAQELALRAAAAEHERRLEESLRQAADTHEQVGRLKAALTPTRMHATLRSRGLQAPHPAAAGVSTNARHASLLQAAR